MKPFAWSLWTMFLWIFTSTLFLGCVAESAREKAHKEYIAAVDAYTVQNYEQALVHVTAALRKDSGFYQARFLEAKIIFFEGNLTEAEKMFRKLYAKHKEYTEARIWHIRCLILLGQFEKAKNLLEKELSYNPGDWRVYYLYALLGEKTDDYEMRLSMNRKAETALMDSAKVYVDLALTWKTLGVESRAREYVGKASAISGTNLSYAQLEKALYQVLE